MQVSNSSLISQQVNSLKSKSELKQDAQSFLKFVTELAALVIKNDASAIINPELEESILALEQVPSLNDQNIDDALNALDHLQVGQLQSQEAAFLNFIAALFKVETIKSPEVSNLNKLLGHSVIKARLLSDETKKHDGFWQDIENRAPRFDKTEIQRFKSYASKLVESNRAKKVFSSKSAFYAYGICPESYDKLGKTIVESGFADEVQYGKTFDAIIPKLLSAWKTNVLSNKEKILEQELMTPEKIAFIENMREPESFQDFVALTLEAREAGITLEPSIQYDKDGVSGYICVNTKMHSGHRQAQNDDNYRVYLNPKPEYFAKVVEALMARTAKNALPINFKFVNPNRSARKHFGNADKLVVYTSKDLLPEQAAVVEQLYANHRDWFETESTAYAAELQPGLGVAKSPEPDSEGTEISFNENLSRFNNELWTEVAKDIMQKNADLEVRNGESKQNARNALANVLRDNRFIPHSQVDNFVDQVFETGLGFEQFTSFISDETMEDRYEFDDEPPTKLEALTTDFNDATRKMIPYIVDSADIGTLSQSVEAKLADIASKHNIDINNMAFSS
jgi:hypothetical protein